MRAVIQRVSRASVVVEQTTIGEIGVGLLVLLGVEKEDTQDDLRYTFNKSVGLRVFPDEHQKMNRSLKDVGGQLLVVSQFTLLGDVRKGQRPSFINAAEPEMANRLYEAFVTLDESPLNILASKTTKCVASFVRRTSALPFTPTLK